MSGVAIMRELLAALPSVISITTRAGVVSGILPQAAKPPALSIHQVGSNEEATLARNMPNKMTRERVQVTAVANSYAVMKALLKAADPGSGVHTGVVLGFKVNSILPAGIGPEIPPGADGVYEQSRDYVVTFLETN